MKHAGVNSRFVHRHPWWAVGQGGKYALNNLRVLIQPFGAAWLRRPWMVVFPLPGLIEGLQGLPICITLDT